MTMTAIDTPPPNMTSSEGRIAHMRAWVDQLEVDMVRLSQERDALWQAIAVLDPDATIGRATVLPIARPVLPPEGASTVSFPTKPSPAPPSKRRTAKAPRSKVADKTAGGSKYDYAKVADVALGAHASGLKMGPAVAEHFDVSSDMGRWLVQEARRRGYDVPRMGSEAPVTQISAAKSARTSRPAPPAERRAGGPQSRDYRPIAAKVLELRDAGEPVAEGLAKHFGVPLSTSKNWVKRCRDLGLVKPLVAGVKVIEDNTIDPAAGEVYDADLVAGEYLDAIRENRRPIQSVADRFGIDKQTAIGWVRQARLDGVLAPTSTEPQLSVEERRALLDMSKPETVA